VTFARLTGAYWLKHEGEDCVWCGALLGSSRACATADVAVRADHRSPRESRRSPWRDLVRVVIVPMAVLVVASALAAALL
jgi:hypothetical protein